MAKIVEYRDISLDELVIGRGQARTQDPGAEIEDLARSIAMQGLLQPIVVCPAERSGKWEILTGQRRFLAHRSLNKEKIAAAILDERVTEREAKAISITENLLRRKLTGVDLKNGLIYLYNQYGTIRDVVAATGLPYEKVRDNVKYPRLIPALKDMVNEQSIDINAAVKAQDAATDSNGKLNEENAIKLALEMQHMSGVQRKKIVRARRDSPDKPIEEVIEDAKAGSRVDQITVIVTSETYTAIQQFANSEGADRAEAAAMLIEEALVDRGLLSGE